MASVVKDAVVGICSLTECCICLTTYKDPRVLACLHTCCLKCFEDIQEKDGKKSGDEIPCPLCRKMFTIPSQGMKGLQKNFFIQSFIEVTRALCSENKVVPCSSCSSNNEGSKIPEATRRCANCCECYCLRCSKSHEGQKLTKDHKIYDLNQSLNEDEIRNVFPIQMCAKHFDRVLDFYCSDCKIVVCVSCFVEEHKLHECKDVKTVEKGFREKLEECVAYFPYFSEQMLSKKFDIENQKKNFQAKILETENNIKSKCQEVKALIDQHAQMLLNELSQLKLRHQKIMEADIEDTERNLTVLESFVAYCKELKSKGSASAVCDTVDNLIRRANELREEYEHYSCATMKSIEIEFTATDQNVLLQYNRNVIGELSESVKHLKSYAIAIGRSGVPTNTTEVIKVNLNDPEDVSSLPNIPTEMQYEAAAAVHCNSIFVTGLGKYCDEIWKFDAASHSWSQCASKFHLRNKHTVAFVGHILFICRGLDVAALDAISEKCTTVGRLKYAFNGYGNCVPYKDSLYIFGKFETGVKPVVDHVQVYDIKSNACSLLSTPMPRADQTLRAALLTKSVLLIGRKSCLIYNFDKDYWQERDHFKTGVNGFGLTATNDKLFVIGGEEQSTDENGEKRWINRDDIRYVSIKNILKDDPIEWTQYAKLPKPLVILSFTKIDYSD